MRVAITGASGVLGRAINSHLLSSNIPTLPLSLTRTTPSPLYPNLPAPTPLDLLNTQAVKDFFTTLQNGPEGEKIQWLIHCAAERRPDEVEKDVKRAEALNRDSVGLLAELGRDLGFGVIYISTDYVFDGKSPPYAPSDAPNPLNLYGQLKRAGEDALLAVRAGVTNTTGEEGGKFGLSVLRVPLLYGEVEYNTETAVNLFIDIIEDQSGKQYTMDHFAVRFPTCVEDVARVIKDLILLNKPLPPVIHYSSQTPLTKYQQLSIIANHLSLPITHVKPDTTDPSTLPQKEGAVQRPGNTQLSVEELRELGVDVGEGEGGFEGWWKGWVGRNRG